MKSRVFLGLVIIVGLALTLGKPKDTDCIKELSEDGYHFITVDGFDKPNCTVQNPIRLTATPTTKLSSPVTLSCQFAKDFGDWTQSIGARHIKHVGGYNCRKIAGSVFMSQHSYGNAIDVAAIDGIPISKNWRASAKKACWYFNNVLTPETDRAHHDHLHLDNGLGVPCWAKSIKRFAAGVLGDN